jgi:hypothetical protein
MRGLLLLVSGYHDDGDFIRLLSSKAPEGHPSRNPKTATCGIPLHAVCRGLLRPGK